jgi:hypothetical protein
MMESYSYKYYSFSEHPQSDSCWSLSTGPDGKIYAAACNENNPGGAVKIVRYNDESDSLEYLVDVPKVLNDPVDSGRGTQCKIHYSFAPSKRDGILYSATHLSGPPIDLEAYSPWRMWHDKKRCFRGAGLIAYDTTQDQVLWSDIMLPKEGCRCLAIDEKRQVLYSISYPRDHLFAYSLKNRQLKDLGRIGSVNSQAIFVDRRGYVWMTDDYGHMLRYLPDQDILETTPLIIPHSEFQNGWHCVLYDVVNAPDRQAYYMIPWSLDPHLIRFWPEEGKYGRLEDLGPINQARDTGIIHCFHLDHAGGLVFDNEGYLYYVHSRWQQDSRIQFNTEGQTIKAEGVVMRINPATLEKKEITTLKRGDESIHYITRGAKDRNGNLFWGIIASNPVGFFKLQMPQIKPSPFGEEVLRSFG